MLCQLITTASSSKKSKTTRRGESERAVVGGSFLGGERQKEQVIGRDEGFQNVSGRENSGREVAEQGTAIVGLFFIQRTSRTKAKTRMTEDS